MKPILLICLLLFLLAGCKRETCCGIGGTEMVRTQTQCADAWGYGPTSDSTVNLLGRYLSQKRIFVNSMLLESAGQPINCNACTCSSGYAFHAWVSNQYIDSLSKEGFVVK